MARAQALHHHLDEAKVTVAMTQPDAVWDQLFPAEQAHIVKLLVKRLRRILDAWERER